MKLHVIKKLAYFGNTEVVKDVHYVVFHGTAKRQGRYYPHDPAASLENEIRDPLELTRSGQLVPAVFMPSSSFVVASDVRRNYADTPHIEFLKVHFDKLVNFYYGKGDMSYYYGREYVDPLHVIKQLPDVAEYHTTIGDFYEMVVARHQDVVPRYANLTKVEKAIGPTPQDEPFRCAVCEEMMGDYPVQWNIGGTLFSEQAFRIIEPHIDWDYYLRVEIEV
jgi:hypothetical protein